MRMPPSDPSDINRDPRSVPGLRAVRIGGLTLNSEQISAIIQDSKAGNMSPEEWMARQVLVESERILDSHQRCME